MIAERKPLAKAAVDEPSGGRAMRVVESRDLLGSTEELLIRHGGRIYRLRRTRLGKLILTA